MARKGYIIAGIGTDVGKTIVSAIVAEALRANYWKPIQAGDLDNSDSINVMRLTKNVNVLDEAYRLTLPMSPHAAAERDSINIELRDLAVPYVEGPLIIEGAGGVMVPFNQNGETFLDVFTSWERPLIIVSRHYLGSINHTLLTIEALKNSSIDIHGIIFIGNENPSTESIIETASGVNVLGRVPIIEEINQAFIIEQAAVFKNKL